MVFIQSLSAAALLCLMLATGAARANSGWLVYELQFTVDADSSMNFDFYEGAYAVAPVTGGRASLVLTSQTDGRVFAVAPEAARVFAAATLESTRTVLSAVALNGSAQACYAASGEVTQTLNLPSPQGVRAFRVAGELRGHLLASDDDSEIAILPPQGQVGMVGAATVTGKLREDLSYNASQFATLAEAVDYVTGLLERYGYQAEATLVTTGQAGTIEGGMEAGAVVEESDEGAEATLFPPGSGVMVNHDIASPNPQPAVPRAKN